MDNIFTLAFWKRTFENSVHAFAGGMLGSFGAGELGAINSVPWYAALSAGVIAAVISTLASLASQRVPDTAPASFAAKGSEDASTH